MKLTSIIILNWNGLSFTKQCIESIHRNTLQPFEVIVVDNGSSEEERQSLRKMKASGRMDVLIENDSNRGFSAANNQGLRKAKGSYIVLLNNDTIVTEKWLDELIKTGESDKKIGIVGPHLPESETGRTFYGGGFIDLAGRARHSFSSFESEAEQVGGAAFFFKRIVFDKIGELDEGFSPIYFEETDYCARARKAGFRAWFTPKSRIIHFGSKITEKQLPKWQYVVINKNRVRYMLLHFSVPRLFAAVPFEIARIAKSLFKFRVGWLLKAYYVNLLSLGEILKKRGAYRRGTFRLLNAKKSG